MGEDRREMIEIEASRQLFPVPLWKKLGDKRG